VPENRANGLAALDLCCLLILNQYYKIRVLTWCNRIRWLLPKWERFIPTVCLKVYDVSSLSSKFCCTGVNTDTQYYFSKSL